MSDVLKILFRRNLKRLKLKSRRKRKYAKLMKSLSDFGLFDRKWYLTENPDVRDTKIDPLLHYIRYGAQEGRRAYPIGKNAKRLHSKSSKSSKSRTRINDFKSKLLPFDRFVENEEDFEVKSVHELAQTEPNKILWRQKGEIQKIPNLHVIGDGMAFPADAEIRAPDRYVAQLENVIIIGGTRYVITRDKVAHHDELASHLVDDAVTIKHFGTSRIDDHKIRLRFSRVSGTHIDEGIHLLNEHDVNYFHFLVEVLPRLEMFDRLEGFETTPLLISKKAHPNLLDILDRVNVKKRPIIEIKRSVAYQVDRLYYPSDISRILDVYTRRVSSKESRIATEPLRQLRERILSGMPASCGRSRRRLYVRRGNRARKVVNEQAIESMLVDHGFEILAVDGLSIECQVKIFREAEVVVAPTGAAVANLLWSRPGTKAVILSASHPSIQLPLWQEIADVSGATISFVVGPRTFDIDGIYSMHDNYLIPLDSLQNEVARLLGSHSLEKSSRR